MVGGQGQCARGERGAAYLMGGRPTVYYDGGCPVCVREIALYRRRVDEDQLDWVDVTKTDAGALGADLSREAALARLHVRRADGSLIAGAAAFAEIWERIEGMRWLAALLAIRPVGMLAEQGYRLFLRVRKVWR